MPEKRNYTRVPLRGSVTLTGGKDPLRVLEGELTDIGYGGFCALFKEEPIKAEAFSFALTAEGTMMTLGGKGKVQNVVQVNHLGETYFRAGIALTEVDKHMIVAFINTHQQQPKQRPPNTSFNVGPF